MERPTLANWMQPPGNRWAFRHVRELIPSAGIKAGPPYPLGGATVGGLLDLSFSEPNGKGWTLRRYLDDTCTDALVVLHQGRVVLEWYAPGMQADDRHIIFSVSKSVTGLLAGALAEAGKLDLDGDVVDYVPEAKSSGYGDATVRHLLDMSVSVGFVEDYALGENIMVRYRQAANWAPGADEEGLHDFLCSLPHDGAHGQRVRYLSPNTDMLGWVCERASGLTFAEALSQYVWIPMGAEADGDVAVDRQGAARAAGGISMTARDLARLGQVVLDGGREALPGWFVEDLFSGGDPSLWAAGDYADYLPGAVYRSCWYQLRTDPDVLVGLGLHGQLLYLDRPRQVVVAKLSSWPEPDDEAGDHAAIAASAAVAHALPS
jgi:CubicO group peptidase (beta-lactamase class C family)